MGNRLGMIHSRQTNVERAIDMGTAIDTGISLFDDLVGNPTRILEKAFQDPSLRHLLSPHHVGFLAPPGNLSELLRAIQTREFHVLSVFRSTVVTKQLSQRFNREVGVDVHLCRSMARDTPKIEVFRVIGGLSATDIRTAIPDILHVAYTPREPVDTKTISEQIIREGFEYVGGGINSNKPIPGENIITVLYFRKRQTTPGIPKIELFLPGKHPLPETLPETPGRPTPVSASRGPRG